LFLAKDRHAFFIEEFGRAWQDGKEQKKEYQSGIAYRDYLI
jgi:hypothetical protein